MARALKRGLQSLVIPIGGHAGDFIEADLGAGKEATTPKELAMSHGEAEGHPSGCADSVRSARTAAMKTSECT